MVAADSGVIEEAWLKSSSSFVGIDFKRCQMKLMALNDLSMHRCAGKINYSEKIETYFIIEGANLWGRCDNVFRGHYLGCHANVL